MLIEIPAWAALAVGVLIAVDVVAWVLLRRERSRRREAERRLERLTQRRGRVAPVVATAVVQPGSVAMPVTLVQRKVSGSEAERAPRGEGVTWDDHAAAVAAHKTKLAAAVTEIRDHAAEVEKARVAEVMASDEYLAYVLASEPVRQPDDAERLQPLALEVLAVHGRERPPPPPPIQPEPVVPDLGDAYDVEPDDDPPPDETQVTAQREEEPSAGGRALTPFGVDDQPGYRFPWGSAPRAYPHGGLPEVRPRGELPADWQRPFYRAVAYLKEPIQITRVPFEEWWPGFISGRRVVRSHRRPLFASLRRGLA